MPYAESCCCHVAATMSPSCCHHASVMLPSCCHHVVAMLSLCCQRAATMMPSCCHHISRLCCHHVAICFRPCSQVEDTKESFRVDGGVVQMGKMVEQLLTARIKVEHERARLRLLTPSAVFVVPSCCCIRLALFDVFTISRR